MDLIATGEPVITQADTQVHVGIDLQQGTLTLSRNGNDFAAYHALVMFASADANPWVAQHVKFTATGPDGKSVEMTVDLFNDSCDGPRTGVPAAIWKVVALAATSAGDIGITYAPPGRT
ncbi:hypothetical protein AB0D89_32600 [Streptomyces luteogriseus]|uniref:hypothetical protein n=1 Tax=Streptomyces luteogriseus TaxID=68233 RepID=UPI0033CA3B74